MKFILFAIAISITPAAAAVAVQEDPPLDTDPVEIETIEKLEEIGRALLSRQVAYERMGSVRKKNSRRLSWRVYLLPFLGYPELYESFKISEAWDSQHNRKLLGSMPEVFRFDGDPEGSQDCRLQMIRDGGSVFAYGKKPTLTRLAKPRGSTLLGLIVPANTRKSPWTAPDNLTMSDARRFTKGSLQVFGISDAGVATRLTGVPPNKLADIVRVSGGRRYVLSASGVSSPPRTAATLEICRNLTRVASALRSFRYDYIERSRKQSSRLSWRVHCLPWLGDKEKELHARFKLDEPWDSPDNKKLIAEMPMVFDTGLKDGRTEVVRVQGKKTLTWIDPASPDVRKEHAEVVDGKAQTIIVIRTHEANAVEWTRPQDVDLDEDNPLSVFGPEELPRLAATMASRAIEFPADVTNEEFAAMLSPAGYELVDVGTLRRRSYTLSGRAIPSKRVSGTTAPCLPRHNLFELLSRLQNLGPRVLRPTGSKLSWRVHALPYLGHKTLFEKFRTQEPWDSEHNKSLMKYMPDVFRSRDDAHDSTDTRTVWLTGNQTANFFPGPPRVLRNLRDRRKRQTIRLLEVAADKAVPWTKPVDGPTFDAADPFATTGPIDDFVCVAMRDGSVRYLRPGITAEILRTLVSLTAGEVPPDEFKKFVTKPYLHK